MREVPVCCTAFIPCSPDAVFNCITGDDVLPLVLTGYGPLPGVTHTTERRGSWREAGASRLIHLADGTCVREELTLREPAHRFAYRVWEFEPFLLRWLATEANGFWRFTAQNDGTHIEWTYAFSPRSALTRWLLWTFANSLWRGYMQTGLKQLTALMATQTESPEGAKPATRPAGFGA